MLKNQKSLLILVHLDLLSRELDEMAGAFVEGRPGTSSLNHDSGATSSEVAS